MSERPAPGLLVSGRRKPRCVVCGRYCTYGLAEVFVRWIGYAACPDRCRDVLTSGIDGAMAALLERFAGERKRARRG